MPSSSNFMSLLSTFYLICTDSISHSEPCKENKDEEDNSFLSSHGRSVWKIVSFEEDEKKDKNGEKKSIVVLHVEYEMQGE